MEVMVVVGTTRNNMPELPEVETVKNTLANLVVGKTILSVDIYREKTIQNDSKVFKESLKGKMIKSFSRVGKFIIFHLSDDLVLISHLRMEGKFFLKDENETITKHDLVVFHFTDGTKLIYNDTRRFGIIKLSKKNDYMNEPPLSNVGPDPLMDIDPKYILKKYKNKSLPIKSVLLDQSIMSGIGNIYADEILFETHIHPLTKAKDLSLQDIKNILDAAKTILSRAVKLGGSTIKSYHPSEGVSGEFQINLKVYNHKDDKCSNCGARLRKMFVNGRGTTYCPHCQKMKNRPFVIGLTGKTATGKTTAGNYFSKHGFIYLNSDEYITSLYQDKAIINEIKTKFPRVINDNKVDKKELRELLTEDLKFKKRFESFIHEELFFVFEREINSMTKDNVIILEVPLLFEAGYDSLCDKTVLITTNLKNQKERISLRNIDVEKALKLNETFNEEDNKKKADIVIINNNDLQLFYQQLDKIIYDIKKHH